MPGAHRDTDSRFCGASTTVQGQSTVFVNDLLWSVDGDPNTHGAGENRAVYGAKNVYVENILIICAVGDVADPDNQRHPAPPTDPSGHSENVIVYEGGGGSSGGGST